MLPEQIALTLYTLRDHCQDVNSLRSTLKKVKEIVESKFLGKIVNMRSTFNIKVYKQKNFFGIKIKKPDYSNRLFNKALGGGAILDIGCYPVSLSTFVNSLTHKVQFKDIILEIISIDSLTVVK